MLHHFTSRSTVEPLLSYPLLSKFSIITPQTHSPNSIYTCCFWLSMTWPFCYPTQLLLPQEGRIIEVLLFISPRLHVCTVVHMYVAYDICDMSQHLFPTFLFMFSCYCVSNSDLRHKMSDLWQWFRTLAGTKKKQMTYNKYSQWNLEVRWQKNEKVGK